MKADKKNELVHEIMVYVSENYADSDFCMGVICDQFRESYEFLLRIFKQKTGVTIMDYRNKLRVERAKELLLEGHTATDVAVNLGYTELRALIRVFRRYEKVTPGEYAKRRFSSREQMSIGR